METKTTMDENSLNGLRELVHECLAKHLYDAAIFFADKVVTLTNYCPIDVYNLANSFFVAREFRRCLHILRTTELIEADIRFRYLAARCLFEIKEWDECLETLGGLDITNIDPLKAFPAPPCTTNNTIDYVSAMCLLRGQVYDALENFPRAVMWYKEALIKDPLCVPAFEALVGRHKLPLEQETAIAAGIAAKLSSKYRWVGLLYLSKCKEFSESGGTELATEALALLGGDLTGQGVGRSPGGIGEAQIPGQYQSMQTTPSTGNTSGQDVSMAGVTPPLGTNSGGAAGNGSGAAVDEGSGPPPAKRANSASMAISPISEGSEGGGGPTPSPTATDFQKTRISKAYDIAMRVMTPLKAEGKVKWDLSSNPEVIASQAEILICRGRFQDAFNLTLSVLEKDPYCSVVLPAHVAAAVALGKKHELFALGHSLMKARPDEGPSWYVAGSYYFCTGQYASARHYFAKATSLDRYFAPAWIGFAQAFAAQDETDQAMAAFRSASRLFPGLHVPLLGMGLEYIRMNNFPLAEQMFMRAFTRCPADPIAAHELGTLAYRQGKYIEAIQWLTKALHGMPREYPGLWEPTVVNLGHAYRKLRRFEEAADMFTRAIGAAPQQASTFVALGFTQHLMGNLSAAIDNYHKALALRPADDFAASMLAQAVSEETESMTRSLQQPFSLGLGAK